MGFATSVESISSGAAGRSYGWLAGGQEVEWLFQPPIQPRRIKMSTFDQTDAPAASEYATVHMAFELSKANWKIGVLLPGAPKLSRFTVKGGDVTTLSGRLASLRAKAERCGKPVRILSC